MASIAKMSYDEESISLAILLATKSMGYLKLRPLQEQVVKHFVGGRDVFVSFPPAVASRCATLSYRLSYLRFLVPGKLIPDSLADRLLENEPELKTLTVARENPRAFQRTRKTT